jgi:primosomal replication protein N
LIVIDLYRAFYYCNRLIAVLVVLVVRHALYLCVRLCRFSGKPNLIRLLDHGSVSASKGQHRQVLLLFPFFGGGSAWDRVETALRDGASTLQDSSGPPPAFPAPPNWPFPEREALQVRRLDRPLQSLTDGLTTM